MRLKFSIPKKYLSLINIGDTEKIKYCVPFDIDEKGDYIDDSFVVVTDTYIYVLSQGRLLNSIELKKCGKFTAEGVIGAGILSCIYEGKETVLARYSMHHAIRYSYVAKGCNVIIFGDGHEVESKEPEKICPKCNRVIPGTEFCPYCDGGWQSFKNIAKLMVPYIPLFIVLSLSILAVTGMTLWQQEVQKQFIDNVLVPQEGQTVVIGDIWKYVILIAISVFGLIALAIFKRIISVILGSKVSLDLRKKLFMKIQQLSLSYQSSRKPGDLMNRIMGDTAQIRGFIEGVFSNVFNVIVTLIGALTLMALMDWKLTIIAVVFMPFVIIISRIFHKKMHRMFRNQRQKDDKINSHLQDVLSGIKVVKIYGREDAEIESFNQDAEAYRKIQQKNEVFWAMLVPFMGFVAGLGTAVVLYFGGLGILDGTGFTIGEMSQFVSYTGMLLYPLTWLTNVPRMLMQVTISLSRVEDILGQEPDIIESEKPINRKIEGTVEFKNVTFGYQSYNPILEEISVDVKPGEMIGLVGASGAGKSTFINLLMRLYDCDEGELLIDGIDIKDYSSDCLHSQIGVVLQETFLFADTIMNNIRFAKPDATREEVIHAAKIAGAHDFICKFPDGYDTYVGDSGGRLSGGERQRIAIARAVLGNPRILILDEATSSLDTESEFFIQKGLERLKKGRTTFAIAHRLSTLKGADRLLVIDAHRIAEMGSHAELMGKPGIYKGLVEAQLEMHAVKGEMPKRHGGPGPAFPPPPPPR